MATNRTPSRFESQGPFVVRFEDDFFEYSASATAAAATYYVMETAAGATQLLSLTDPNGVLNLTQTTNDNDVISVFGNAGVLLNTCKPGSSLKFWARFSTADVDDVDLHIGFSIQDVSMQASVPADFCCFRLQEGSALLDLVASKNSNTSVADNILTLADSTWVSVQFEFIPDAVTPSTGSLLYKVDTNNLHAEGSLSVVGNFPDDVVIFPVFQVQNGSTDADLSRLDLWGFEYTLPSIGTGQG